MNRRRPVFELDPTGEAHGGTPTWPWRGAPDGYATRRQLTAMGLRPGGQEPAGQIVRGRRLMAWLYLVALAKPKRTASPAWLAATRKALDARRVCGTCRHRQDYVVPKITGYDCWSCYDARALPRAA